jgi:microsomal dipeptidase-like Zn-dependent dipeptidase
MEHPCLKTTFITQALIDKGYSDADIRKILGENTLRVLEQAERVSREIQWAK